MRKREREGETPVTIFFNQSIDQIVYRQTE